MTVVYNNGYRMSCDQPVKFDKNRITYYKNHVDRFIEVHSIKTWLELLAGLQLIENLHSLAGLSRIFK